MLAATHATSLLQYTAPELCLAWAGPADRHRTLRELTPVFSGILSVPPTWDIAISTGSPNEESKSMVPRLLGWGGDGISV